MHSPSPPASAATSANNTKTAAPDPDAVAFWAANPPGLKWLSPERRGEPGAADFAAMRAERYRLEPHLPELAAFPRHAGRTVVEVGCGIGLDGAEFAAAGARYVGVDPSPTAVATARRLFALRGLDGLLVRGGATALPLATASADLTWSNGVLHHLHDTAGAARELHRVLRPGGRCVAMLYHRDSLNHRLNIQVLRRLGAIALLAPGGVALAERLTGESATVLDGHRTALRRHGLRYLTDRSLWLSSNTDGPGNPLSKVFSRREATALFQAAGFAAVRTEVRYLNLRTLPLAGRLLGPGAQERLARRWGWHLYVLAER